MNRAELFEIVMVQVTLASGAGPLAGAATLRICASIDEYADSIRVADRVLVDGLKKDLGSLSREG